MSKNKIRFEVDYIDDNELDEKQFKQYQKMKIRVLEDFCVKVKPEEHEHLMNLKTVSEVDRYARGLILDRLGAD